METGQEVEIKIRVEAILSETLGSEFWEIVDVVDEREGFSLGDIGLSDFNAFSDFPEILTEAVIKHLLQYDPFEDETFYSLKLNIYDGGSLLGQASRFFYGKALRQAQNSETVLAE